MSFFRRNGVRPFRHSSRTAGSTRRRFAAALGVERLEDRRLLAAVPYGALPDDTAEYMLGDVLVTVVLMESSNNLSAINPNTENWTPQTIQAAKAKVIEAMQWWEQTLQTQFPGSSMPLDFHLDFTYADSPVLTDYEPIANPSTYFQQHYDYAAQRYRDGWMTDFLQLVGHDTSADFSSDIRAFNHEQRLAHGTDWAFTIFIVNDANDADRMFAPGGFSWAFSFAGGQFLVAPAGRPASSIAHETMHIFWARDEYPGGGNYADRRGYYNSQNLNAVDGNPVPKSAFVTQQQVSLMSKDYTRQEMINLTGGQWQENEGRPLLSSAWQNHTSSTSSLEMIGWRDSDGDGIFDVLDVPLSLDGGGFLDLHSGGYRFLGSSSVQTLPNQNSAGLQSDITINRIGRVEYRIDGGAWLTAATFDESAVSMDLRLPVSSETSHTLEIRTVDDRTGVVSSVYEANTHELGMMIDPGINGVLWFDRDDDGQFELGERPISGWTVRLVDENGQRLNLTRRVEPDGYPNNADLEYADSQVHLRALVSGVYQKVVASLSITPSTGIRVLGYLPSAGATTGVTGWNQNAQLRMDFTEPVSTVRLDAIGAVAAGHGYGRLEAYDAGGNLLARDTTGPLAAGQVETMAIERSVPDIAYAIARQHGNSVVQLDNLQFGADAETITDRSGGYRFPGLPAGSYRVQVLAPDNAPPVQEIQQVTLGEGEAVGSVNFAAQAPLWQNTVEPVDVTGEGDVTPLDALTVINYINSRPDSLDLPAPPQTPPPYYDVDGDGYVTAKDVLNIINRLNEPEPSGMASRTIDVGGGKTHEGEGEWSRSAEQTEWATTDESDFEVSPSNAQIATPALRPADASNRAWREASDGYFLTVAQPRSDQHSPAEWRSRTVADLDDLLAALALEDGPRELGFDLPAADPWR